MTLATVFLIFWGMFYTNVAEHLVKLKSQPPTKDLVAKKMLEKTAKDFKAMQSAEIDFTLLVEIPNSESINQKGKLVLSGDKYKLIMPDQEIYCDNKAVWRYLKEINEVQITDHEPDSDEMTPSKLITIYDYNFEYQYTHDVIFNGKPSHIIDFKPITNNKPYFKIRIWIDKTTFQVNGMQVFDKNGSRYLYKIVSIAGKPAMPDIFFQFNKNNYKSVKVEDLRF